jgi:hypothetical protein
VNDHFAVAVVTSTGHRNLPVASGRSPAPASPALLRQPTTPTGVLPATEKFGDPIVGSSDLRHELSRSVQILRLAQWPPADDVDPGTRRCRLPHAVREVTSPELAVTTAPPAGGGAETSG